MPNYKIQSIQLSIDNNNKEVDKKIIAAALALIAKETGIEIKNDGVIKNIFPMKLEYNLIAQINCTVTLIRV